jgi:hypothetical protein
MSRPTSIAISCAPTPANLRAHPAAPCRTSDDLDGAMLLLASPAGACITGAVIAVDGGHGVAAI